MPSVYKLKSFDYVGVAEPIRYLFAYGGIPYENIIVKKDASWPNVLKTIPFGKLPLLEVDNKIVFQPVVISWYVAHLVGLASDETLEEAELDSISVAVYEFGDKFFQWWHDETDVNQKAKWEQEWEDVIVPKYLADFEEIAQKKGGYFGGKKISWADVCFAGVLATVQGNWKKEILHHYPHLHQIYKDVHNIPAIKAYVTKYVPHYKY